MRYVWSVACVGNGVVNSSCSGKPNGKTPFGTARNRRVDNIKTDLQETGQKAWVGLIWLRTGKCGRLLQTW